MSKRLPFYIPFAMEWIQILMAKRIISDAVNSKIPPQGCDWICQGG